VLAVSGCGLKIRQLPGHGAYQSPAEPDPRQLVGRQSPAPGTRASAVTVWLRPLCHQSAAPGPALSGPTAMHGPTRLVVGLFLAGGPLRTSTSCRAASPYAGTITVSAPDGRLVISRTVRQGRYAIFPLPPGRYQLSGSVADGGPPLLAGPRAVTLESSNTTRINLTAQIK